MTVFLVNSSCLRDVGMSQMVPLCIDHGLRVFLECNYHA